MEVINRTWRRIPKRRKGSRSHGVFWSCWRQRFNASPRIWNLPEYQSRTTSTSAQQADCQWRPEQPRVFPNGEEFWRRVPTLPRIRSRPVLRPVAQLPNVDEPAAVANGNFMGFFVYRWILKSPSSSTSWWEPPISLQYQYGVPPSPFPYPPPPGMYGPPMQPPTPNMRRAGSTRMLNVSNSIYTCHWGKSKKCPLFSSMQCRDHRV